jgi:tetratricopeptide (TPR) repeat protein
MQRVPEAVDMYERAANLYAEYGFPNNAIALCNKVLRNAPSRTHVYLRLAQLMVERGLVAQAKENLLEYAQRMQKSGKTDEAFRALKEFADLSPDNEEIRLLLADQLKGADRTVEAREQLAKLFAEAEASGDKRRSRATLMSIKAIDPDFDPAKGPRAKVAAPKQKSSDLVFLDLDDEYRTGEAPQVLEDEPEALVEGPATAELFIEPMAIVEDEPAVADDRLEIETSAMAGADATTEVEQMDGLDLQREFEAPEPLEGLEFEPTALEEEVAEAAEAADEELAGATGLEFELPEIELEPEEAAARGSLEVPDLDLGEAGLELEEAAAEEDVELAAVVEPPAVEEYHPADISTLEAQVADNPDDPYRHVLLGEALIEAGKRERGIEEMDIAVGMFESAEKWKDVSRLVGDILRLEPNSVRHHQKRVEGAFRTNDKQAMVEAYLGLANALLRGGSAERSEMVFRRVLEFDPTNAEAKSALAAIVPEEPAAPTVSVMAGGPAGGGDYVDLGALIFDEEAARDTRMRIGDEEPTGDEEKDFADMLAQFKRGIEANIEDEDWRAHYDLGVAFKEMGLVDEAITEFQKALRSQAGRLRTAESLGGCFYEKRQYSVAATVMRRAVETDPASDDAKIALLYWLGRCDEEMGRPREALTWFQRVFALDIRFADVADRVQRLSAAGH